MTAVEQYKDALRARMAQFGTEVHDNSVTRMQYRNLRDLTAWAQVARLITQEVCADAAISCISASSVYEQIVKTSCRGFTVGRIYARPQAKSAARAVFKLYNHRMSACRAFDACADLAALRVEVSDLREVPKIVAAIDTQFRQHGGLVLAEYPFIDLESNEILDIVDAVTGYLPSVGHLVDIQIGLEVAFHKFDLDSENCSTTTDFEDKMLDLTGLSFYEHLKHLILSKVNTGAGCGVDALRAKWCALEKNYCARNNIELPENAVGSFNLKLWNAQQVVERAFALISM